MSDAPSQGRQNPGGYALLPGGYLGLRALSPHPGLRPAGVGRVRLVVIGSAVLHHLRSIFDVISLVFSRRLDNDP
ncbi:hypothetical protein [Salinactinospora qingdaonensis]|uniref:Uncharacterized protein n=1 Tax=Salinactinospora qingdaonensis TaxID=702744 RepID=A0ABP7FMI6_9ACTN